MKTNIFSITILFLLTTSCTHFFNFQDEETSGADTLFCENFDNLNTKIWKFNYKEEAIPEKTDVMDIVKRSVYSKSEDNCLCLYSEQTKYVSGINFPSYAYFDLTDLNPDKILEIEFSLEVKSWRFYFQVINISNQDSVILLKGFGNEEVISLHRIQNGGYKRTDQLRFIFGNNPSYSTGYECYIDDIKIIEREKK